MKTIESRIGRNVSVSSLSDYLKQLAELQKNIILENWRYLVDQVRWAWRTWWGTSWSRAVDARSRRLCCAAWRFSGDVCCTGGVVNGVPAMCLRWSGLADCADPPLQYDRQQQRPKEWSSPKRLINRRPVNKFPSLVFSWYFHRKQHFLHLKLKLGVGGALHNLKLTWYLTQ